MSSLRPSKLLFADNEDYITFNSGQYQSIVVIIFLYGIILFALSIVYFANSFPLLFSVPLYLLCIFLIGWGQYSIGNGMHEAVHRNLLNKNGDFWASVVVAYPIGLTMRYRDTHLLHHRNIGTNKDPDWGEYNSFPVSRLAMLKRFFWFVSGIPAVLQFLKLQVGQPQSKTSDKKYVEIITFILVQLAILAMFIFIFESPLYYLFFWILPIATVGKLFSSTRLLCEHGSPDRGWVVRSIDGPRWTNWLLGAFDFNYHAEHHLIMSVPFANLQRLHKRNYAYAIAHSEYQPFAGRMELFSGSYLSLLAQWIKGLPWV